MALCITESPLPAPATESHVRVMRWTFRREDETLVCELGLNRDESAYEIRIDPACEVADAASELFDDAISVFQRQAEIERQLVAQGWSLDNFQSDRIAR
jgi:hypothetical protein